MCILSHKAQCFFFFAFFVRTRRGRGVRFACIFANQLLSGETSHMQMHAYEIKVQLDDGWPESAEEHVTLVVLQRECKEYIKDML